MLEVTQLLTLTCPGVVFTGGGSLAAPAGLFWAAPALGLVFWFAAGAEILPEVAMSVFLIECVQWIPLTVCSDHLRVAELGADLRPGGHNLQLQYHHHALPAGRGVAHGLLHLF